MLSNIGTLCALKEIETGGDGGKELEPSPANLSYTIIIQITLIHTKSPFEITVSNS